MSDLEGQARGLIQLKAIGRGGLGAGGDRTGAASACTSPEAGPERGTHEGGPWLDPEDAGTSLSGVHVEEEEEEGAHGGEHPPRDAPDDPEKEEDGRPAGIGEALRRLGHGAGELEALRGLHVELSAVLGGTSAPRQCHD